MEMLFILAVALAMDSVAVSIAIGSKVVIMRGSYEQFLNQELEDFKLANSHSIHTQFTLTLYNYNLYM